MMWFFLVILATTGGGYLLYRKMQHEHAAKAARIAALSASLFTRYKFGLIARDAYRAQEIAMRVANGIRRDAAAANVDAYLQAVEDIILQREEAGGISVATYEEGKVIFHYVTRRMTRYELLEDQIRAVGRPDPTAADPQTPDAGAGHGVGAHAVQDHAAGVGSSGVSAGLSAGAGAAAG